MWEKVILSDLFSLFTVLESINAKTSVQNHFLERRESVVSVLFLISFSWCVDTCNLQQSILKSPRGNLYSDPVSLSNCGFCMEQFRRSQGEVWNVKLLKNTHATSGLLLRAVRSFEMHGDTALLWSSLSHHARQDHRVEALPAHLGKSWMCSDKRLTFNHQLSPMHYLHLKSIRLSPITISRHSEPCGILGKIITFFLRHNYCLESVSFEH